MDNLVCQFKEMKERGTLELLDIILNEVQLTPEQKEQAMDCYTTTNLKGILSMEMGTGKTYVCLGLVQIARCLGTGKKSIISVPKNKVNDFTELLRTSLQCEVHVVTGQKPDIDRLEKNFHNVDVLVAQHSFWTHSMHSLMFMYNHVDDFNFSFYDEADGKNAVGFLAFLEFSRLIPVSFVANATPIGRDTTLVRHLLYSVGATNLSERQFSNRYQNNTIKGGRVVDTTPKIESIKDDFSEYFINLNRNDIGLKAETKITFHPVYQTQIQKMWINGGLRTDIANYSPEVSNSESLNLNPPPTFSPAFVPAIAKLQSLILTTMHKKKIIFVKNTNTVVQLKSLLTAMGLTTYIIDGKHTNTGDMQKQQEDAYNKDPNGVMITTIIKGSNLDSATHIIVYDTPNDLQQLLFRAIRGIKSKTIDVDWIYYPETDLPNLASTLKGSQNVSQMFGREIDLIPQIKKELSRYNWKI